MDANTNSDAIYQILEKEIIDLVIKPGTSLSENELCGRFHVSRTPIRSVLQRLQENGLVTIIPYKGTAVTLLDFDIINQIIYQRVAVETMVLRDFMKLCNPMLLEKIRYTVRRSELLIDADFEVSDFYDLDSQLHEIWFYETKKPYLWDMIQKAQSNYSRFRMMDIVEVHNFAEIVSEHREMLDAITRKDAPAIEPLLTRHLYGGITRLGSRLYTEFHDYFAQK